MKNSCKSTHSGMTFGENKAGTDIHFDERVPFHLLFLLKGTASVKTAREEVFITQNEFVMVEGSDTVNCRFTSSSRYVMIGLDESLPTGRDVYTEFSAVQICPIHTDLSVLLQYMIGTMPLNEKIEHHLIPRIIRLIMRKYSSITNAIDSTK